MAVTRILIYISCLCFARDFVFCDDYEEIGNKITLTPRIRGKPEEILWKHNENKVLEYDGSEVVEYGSFKSRVVVDFETGELTIQKLSSQDSGQYQSDIVINGKVQSSSHTLTVLDALAEPHVSCELDETSNVKKLLCSVESQTQLSYEWSGPNINGHLGPELVVDKQEENLDSVYTCTVKNQVNSKSTNFTLEDCHTGREGSAVLVPVLIVTILLILLIALAIFLYALYKRKKQKQARPSEPKNMDPENGQGQNLLSNVTTESVPGSSDAIATLPSHIRLPSQKESIADKKWYQDNKPENLGETEKLLKETNRLQEQNLKQSPQSDVTETNQENTGKGDEGELKYEKNSENAFEAEGNTYSKPDETEKESDKPLQSQEEEEKEKSQTLKQESENGKKSPEHQNERLEEQKTEDNNEDNQTPGETEEVLDRPDTGSSDVTLPSHIRLTSQKEPVTDRKWDQDNEPEDSGETDEGQKTKKMSEQNLKQSPQSVSETNQENTGIGNEKEVDRYEKNSENDDETEKESHKPLQSQEEEKKEKSQIPKQESENGEKSPEHQNEGLEEQKTEDNNEDNQTPGETEEVLDRPDTVIDSPANLEKEPINSTVASSSQTDLHNYTDQDKEEERKCPGLGQDEKREVVTNQEEKGGQEQMLEEKNHDPEISDEISCINFEKQDKQTDPDSTINTVSQQQGHDDGLSNQDKAVPACPEKSDMTNKNLYTD
ncbi:dentin matrix acidic phosphoprotein 1-like isoform X2 [Ctenopharyngodon idella]|uniref:dentin matrix acidic phosphoprotein 1-like isoform X2 n=1 Tax=Ctenopharyngodon idella TaxID=7959 RepID=UPI002230A033|nr:dentin matrix acidic phosphoprotein 1-like isoform X2 [Ctenopharyngodon idella]